MTDRAVDHLSCKLVGQRLVRPSTWDDADRVLVTARELRGGRGLAPRGLYRFTSFEEAQTWLTKAMVSAASSARLTLAASPAPSPKPTRATS
jgi:hypothetical protein